MAETIFHSVFRVDAENKNFPKLCVSENFSHFEPDGGEMEMQA